ncbi:hypothetical protein TTRE_0000531401 [Trichuris trichiura]|uniref:Uncharacterized protein n=1 Tax=Trichuris trichiura TaxID=36087 RepID=A0A077Z9X4_TRITR|nr:hypothetical protein TTRE_0000531401 [Trichuris trichiura]
MPNLSHRVEVYRKVGSEGQVLCVLVKIKLHVMRDAGYPPLHYINQSPLMKMANQNTWRKGPQCNFARDALSQFQSLTQVGNEAAISEARVKSYCKHLQALHDDFTRRFPDILSMVIPDWVINPLTNLDDEEISLQEQLLELQSNVELKARSSQGYQPFWLQKEVQGLYSGVWGVVKNLLICLPSSSLVEHAFSIVTDLVTKKCSRLQVVRPADVRLRVTSIELNIDKLVRSYPGEPSSSL